MFFKKIGTRIFCGPVIRMRLAARAPPPPYLKIGVCCSYLHSAACSISIGVWWFSFFLALDVCIFLQLSACSWCFPPFRFVPGGFDILQMLLQRSNQNPSKKMPKSIKIDPQIILNRRTWCPGTLQKWSWKQVVFELPKMALRLPRNFGFLVPLGRFWAPFWDPAGRQGVPKSSILASRRAKMSKNEVQNEASEKAWNFNWI